MVFANYFNCEVLFLLVICLSYSKSIEGLLFKHKHGTLIDKLDPLGIIHKKYDYGYGGGSGIGGGFSISGGISSSGGGGYQYDRGHGTYGAPSYGYGGSNNYAGSSSFGGSNTYANSVPYHVSTVYETPAINSASFSNSGSFSSGRSYGAHAVPGNSYGSPYGIPIETEHTISKKPVRSDEPAKKPDQIIIIVQKPNSEQGYSGPVQYPSPPAAASVSGSSSNSGSYSYSGGANQHGPPTANVVPQISVPNTHQVSQQVHVPQIKADDHVQGGYNSDTIRQHSGSVQFDGNVHQGKSMPYGNGQAGSFSQSGSQSNTAGYQPGYGGQSSSNSFSQSSSFSSSHSNGGNYGGYVPNSQPQCNTCSGGANGGGGGGGIGLGLGLGLGLNIG